MRHDDRASFFLREFLWDLEGLVSDTRIFIFCFLMPSRLIILSILQFSIMAFYKLFIFLGLYLTYLIDELSMLEEVALLKVKEISMGTNAIEVLAWF